MIQGKIDVFVVFETKIDESFPMCQFKIDGFSLALLDWTEIRRGRYYHAYQIRYTMQDFEISATK